MEAWENAIRRAEEHGEAEGEEVGCVAQPREDVARYLEVLASDLDDSLGVKELGDEARYYFDQLT